MDYLDMAFGSVGLVERKEEQVMPFLKSFYIGHDRHYQKNSIIILSKQYLLTYYV